MSSTSQFSFDLTKATADQAKAKKEVYFSAKGIDAVDLAPQPTPYASLRPSDIYEMATRPANLSKAYADGELNASSEVTVFVGGSSNPREGRNLIDQLMSQLNFTLLAAPCFEGLRTNNPENLESFREDFRAHLEDPGFLAHARFYDSVADSAFLCFYYDLWQRNGVHANSFFLGQVWAPDATCWEVDLDSSWGKFISLEGMALASRELNARWSNVLTFSALEHWPESNNSNRSVNLLGFSLNHPLENLKSLLLSGARQLDPGGVIGFDLPIKNPSLRLLTKTIAYPTFSDFHPFRTAGKAVRIAHGLVDSINTALRVDAEKSGKPCAFMDYAELVVVSNPIWGDLALFVVLKKNS